MPLFGALHTSATGLHAYRTWLDAVSDNIANINTVRSTSEAAFQERRIVTAAVPTADAASPGVGAGVRVVGVAFGDAEGRLVYDPQHPLADENGLVRAPDVDLGDQMVQLLVAQRAYQANLAVVERATESYEQAIGIGGR